MLKPVLMCIINVCTREWIQSLFFRKNLIILVRSFSSFFFFYFLKIEVNHSRYENELKLHKFFLKRSPFPLHTPMMFSKLLNWTIKLEKSLNW